MYDLVIRNGVWWTGASLSERRDVAIQTGRIASVAKEIRRLGLGALDAAGHLVTPGLIDITCTCIPA